MNYNVTMVKLGSPTVDEGGVGGRFKTLLDDVINSNRALRTRFADLTSIIWTTSCPDRYNEWDLLVYVVPSDFDSVVKALNPNTSAGQGGLTTWRWQSSGGARTEETGSEVYARRTSDAVLLGNLCFHEALHNKGHFSDESLHRHGGLAGETVSATTNMTPAVRNLMAGILGNNRPQWLGGCSYYNDPLR
jgi:hypothetical protein